MSDHNVVPIRGQQKKAPPYQGTDAPDIVDRWMVAQHIVDARDHLSQAEAELLHAVNRLSFGYGRGFCLKSRDEVARTARMSVRTFERIVPNLVRRGVLIREATFHFNKLRINHEVLEDMVNTPKRLRQDVGPPSDKMSDPPSDKMSEPIEENPREENPREEKPGGSAAKPPAPSEPSARDLAQEEMNRWHRRRTQEAENARKHLKLDAIEETWHSAWRREYQDLPVKFTSGWTGNERIHALSILSTWSNSDKKGRKKRRGGTRLHRAQQLHDFIEWTISYWDDVRASEFSWMRREPPPRHPDVVFLAKHLRRFRRLFEDWRRGEWSREARNKIAAEVSELPLQDRVDYYRGRMAEERQAWRQQKRDRD